MSQQVTILPTPCLLLDLPVLERNLSRVKEIAQDAGVDLRPHCKTAKSSEVANRATAGFSGAITVATLHEAEYFADHGFTNITYAVGFIPSKLDRVIALQHRGVTINVLTDSIDVARKLSTLTADLPNPLPILIEIEAGAERTGLLPHSDDLLPLATAIHESPNLQLLGVLAFGGAGYGGQNRKEIEDFAEIERTSVVHAAERIRQMGIECPVVSVGSTPNVLCAVSFEGITEIRPGVYVFGDLMMHALGLYRFEEIAVTVHASIIGHSKAYNRIYIDAGALALSKDHGLERDETPYAAYGLIRQSDSPEPYEGIGVTNVNQEHGFVECLDPTKPFPFHDFSIGDTVRVLPHHVCHTVSCYDHYHILDDTGGVITQWPRTIGW